MIQIQSTYNRDLDKISSSYLSQIFPFLKKRVKKYIPQKQLPFFEIHLVKILIGNPSELIHLQNKYKSFCTKNKTELNKGVRQAFSYANFTTRKTYNAYSLAQELHFNVCPYCNRQYTFTVSNAVRNITRPVFDHFFSKELYPILALSFYNLIPCCSICNSQLKGNKKFTLKKNIHPYVSGFENDFIFNYIPDTADGAIGLTDEITITKQIRAKSTYAKQIAQSCDVFKFEDIYQSHRDIVREIIRKHYVSGGKYLNMLLRTFPDMKATNDELYQLAFGNFYKTIDLEKRPLGKLSRDIFEQLKFEVI